MTTSKNEVSSTKIAMVIVFMTVWIETYRFTVTGTIDTKTITMTLKG